MVLLLIIVIIILLFVIYWLSKLKNQEPPVNPPDHGSVLRSPIEFTDGPSYNPQKSALLMLRPGYNLNDVKAYFGQVINDVKIVAYCKSCDFLLFSVDGLNAELIGKIVKGQTQMIPPKPPQGPPQPTSTGELGPVIYGFDYELRSPRMPLGDTASPRQFLQELGSEDGEKSSVMVAILDTGLNAEIAKQYTPGVSSHCMGTLGAVGYNTIDNIADTSDNFGAGNNVPGHGTPVAGMVLRTAAKDVNVKILPVKILDENGGGTLLQAMCGIAYAKNAGAKIINASFGFYTQDAGQAYFFKEFIDRMTTDNTLIIAAAGNADDLEDTNAEKRIGKNELRNLDKHLFYPAAFSEHNPNVITVTTVQVPNKVGASAPVGETTSEELSVAEKQNFSAKKVQIGVQGDIEHYFLNPFGRQGFETWPTWTGSSFAAPKLTGIIAATYYRYLDEMEGMYDRENYLNWLCQNGYLQEKQTVINNGYTAKENVPQRLLMLSNDEYYVPIERNT